ncbi:DUF1992 domain-containing protein [Jiangella asiatica]|uniref:DUF1992 domain-containing protein n=1 Tax=Jiangella asiatica TaxID=2530372 RepID=A0A4R5CIX2_9ACTN|nr:DUF1992 domain-containing protein [Jiangella asiatica]TDD99076.1 DUF1992 domain-containing protein [Jiangella asiatica]
MTERKPSGLNFESWIDKQIREAQERGEFDDLPLSGKPLPSRRPGDELWWVREKLAREGETTDALLPTPLKLRKEIHRLPETLRDVRSELAVRDVVDELNERIKQWLRAPSGPQIAVGVVDAEAVVEQWRADRAEREQEAAAQREAAAEQAARRAAAERAAADHARAERRAASWWRRLGARLLGR